MIPKPGPKQPSNIISHWYVLTEGHQFSAQEFYGGVEDELAARNVPRLKVSRVEFHEGSVVSDKRIYLRLARERYAFDVCAAPFGTGYFFSLRLVEKPRSWIQFFLLLFASTFLWGPMRRIYYEIEYSQFRYTWWWIGGAVVAGAVWWIIKQQLVAYGTSARKKSAETSAVFRAEMPDFDAFILNTALVGAWYERVRKDTYHRYDTRLLYQTLITDIVKKKVDEVTSAKGLKLIRTYDYNPILGELYQRKVVKTGQGEEEEAVA